MLKKYQEEKLLHPREFTINKKILAKAIADVKEDEFIFKDDHASADKYWYDSKN